MAAMNNPCLMLAASDQQYWPPNCIKAMTAAATALGLAPDFCGVYAAIGDTSLVKPASLDPIKAAYRLHVSLTPPAGATLEAISNGSFNAEIQALAKGLLPIATWTRPLYEMNAPGNSYGMTPAAYVAAYQNIQRQWWSGGNDGPLIWCPNITKGIAAYDFAPYYPGDGFVKIVGLDGYPDAAYPWSFEQLFAADLEMLAKLAPHKPIIIGEFGCPTGVITDRPAWIAAAFVYLASVKKRLNIIGVNYFDRGEWSITNPAYPDSAACCAGFRVGYGALVAA